MWRNILLTLFVVSIVTCHSSSGHEDPIPIPIDESNIVQLKSSPFSRHLVPRFGDKVSSAAEEVIDLDEGIEHSKKQVEVKTEPPPESNKFADCPIYDINGALRQIRKHNEVWYNQGSDCEICKCVSGDRRCLYHYCNANAAQFITPPSDELFGSGGFPILNNPKESSYGGGNIPEDDEDTPIDYEESSGYPPSWMDIPRYISPSSNKPQKYNHVSSGIAINWRDQEIDEIRSEEEEDDEQNEIQMNHPIDNEILRPKQYPMCTPNCKKTCPHGHGFKIDRLMNCFRCKCLRSKSMKRCKLDCPEGYATDSRGHKKCKCKKRYHAHRIGNDLDIVLVDNAKGSVFDLDSTRSMNEIKEYPKTDKEGKEGCNTTAMECHDGEMSHNIGSEWNRGPCVTCKCISNGFTICVVKQCPAVICHHSTPIIYDRNSCCPRCADSPKEHMEKHDISSSRVHNHNLRPLDDHKNHKGERAWKDQLHHSSAGDDAIKSAVREDWSQLLYIIIPIFVIMIPAMAVIIHFWRKYHRDKYDISAFRPEEKEKLRPVKTMNDEQLPVRHV